MTLTWTIGKTGFNIAGLALISAAIRQWSAGGLLRLSPRASAVVVPQGSSSGSGRSRHYTSGPAFVMWIADLGILLEPATWRNGSPPCRGGI